MAERILILGGTGEARELAAALADDGLVDPVTALAGRTAEPAPVAGAVRTGGFGGADGLAAHLREEGYAALVDATHPFARQISAHAAAAARVAGVPRLALLRPGWRPEPGDRWIEVADEDAAAAALGGLGLPAGGCVFLALGRQRVTAFASLPDRRFVLRTVDPVEPPWPGCRVITGRGPFDAAAEQVLLAAEGVAALVCRNSGGASGRAKLDAARGLGLPVVMIRRPPPPAPPTAASVAAAVAWLEDTLTA
jgi:precorrin-6A/cobalt-precorrin-6A reductase